VHCDANTESDAPAKMGVNIPPQEESPSSVLDGLGIKVGTYCLGAQHALNAVAPTDCLQIGKREGAGHAANGVTVSR
jgi:hypothetical protein